MAISGCMPLAAMMEAAELGEWARHPATGPSSDFGASLPGGRFQRRKSRERCRGCGAHRRAMWWHWVWPFAQPSPHYRLQLETPHV